MVVFWRHFAASVGWLLIWELSTPLSGFYCLTEEAGNHAWQSAFLSQQDEPTVDELIRQLSHERFDVRDAASQRLVAIGSPALRQLEANRVVGDNETRLRISRISQTIRRNDLERGIYAFLHEPDGSLPGWDEFVSLVPGEENSRELFVELYRISSTRFENLVQRDRVLASVRELIDEVDSRRSWSTKLDEPTVATLAILYSNLLSDWESIPRILTQRMAAIFDSDQVNVIVSKSRFRPMLLRFVSQWVRTPDNSVLGITHRLNLAHKYGLKEGVAPAEACLKQESTFSNQLLEAFEMLVQHGSPSHLPLIETRFSDANFVHKAIRRQNSEMRYYTTKIQDVALATGVRLSGQTFGDFGFDLLPSDDGPIDLRLAGFTSEQSREGAFRRWRQYRISAQGHSDQ